MRRRGFLLRGLLVAFLVLASVAPSPGAETPAFRLVEAHPEVDFVTRTGDGSNDYIVEANGNGAVLFDHDDDGDLDLLLVSGTTLERWTTDGGGQALALYRNDGDRFTDVTAASGLAMRGWGMGACVGDVDGDGAVDLYVTALGENRLFRNRGDGTFAAVAGEGGASDSRWSHSCAFGDVDVDGDLDLFVANYVAFDLETVRPRGPDTPCGYRGNPTFCGPLGLAAEPDALFRNRGDGTFEEDPEVAALPPAYGMNVVFADVDDDGLPDVYVANDSQPNRLFQAGGSGLLEETAQLAGVALSERGAPQASMGIAVGDYDNDGDLDLFLTNFSQDHDTLYRNHGPGFFSDVSVLAGIAQISDAHLAWGTAFVDLDLDGWLDLYVATGHVYEDVESFGIGSLWAEPDKVLRGGPSGRFVDVSAAVGSEGARSSRGLAVGDLDLDGDPDLVVTNLNEPPTILANDGDHGKGIAILAATSAGAPATGARVVLEDPGGPRAAESGGMGGYLGQHEPAVRFGLGAASRAGSVRIRYLEGRVVRLREVPAGFRYRLVR